MFGMGMPEILLILAVALLVIGPKKLPDLAKSLGKAIGEFKRATGDLKDAMDVEEHLDDLKKPLEEITNSDSNKDESESGSDISSVYDDTDISNESAEESDKKPKPETPEKE